MKLFRNIWSTKGAILHSDRKLSVQLLLMTSHLSALHKKERHLKAVPSSAS
ncbi:hypothetical protein M1K46_18105 [Fictibacillus sp. WQ 8-8]|uniref:hypothetical protein n=1 Tax=Fictibacillus sp. WQ 8-8 TaxID=2938788 RepID=UPI00210901CA|nr:hypothetical protein [Fictibacillus sp. WQ 8-8]MCQ6267551.1 hypothetical protein [Fictibacillus sp. WQ 8-8]